jgi:hypothetical protein
MFAGQGLRKTTRKIGNLAADFGGVFLAGALLYVGVLADTLHAGPVMIPVAAAGTYLRTDPGDPASEPTIVDLRLMGILPGMMVYLRETGTFSYGAHTAITGDFMGALFSPTGIILEPSTVNRVPDAVDIGLQVLSPPTWVNALPTDIPNDFPVHPRFSGGTTTVVVPQNGNFLIVGVIDSYYSDNLLTADSLGITITVAPEPGTAISMATCLLALAAFVHRKAACKA